MIQFSCLQCGMKFKVKEEFAGRASRCPACKHALLVPKVEHTQAFAPGVLDGTMSCLDQAGHHGGVSLPFPSGREANTRPRDGRRFVLEEEIARGGMGAVLRAIDRDLRREVAIKFMLGEQDAGKKARFVE